MVNQTARLRASNKLENVSVKIRLTTTLMFTLLAFPTLSCGGDGTVGSSAQPTVDITGTWTGSWFSSDGVNSGTATLTATQSGATFTGSASLLGYPCSANGSFSGNVSGNTVSGSLAGGFPGTIFESKMDITMTVTGNSARGTFYTFLPTVCAADTGTIFDLTR